MKTIQLLEANDVIQATDWCRPLTLITMSGGHSDDYSFESVYGGSPENNTKWARVTQVLGKPWIGKTVGDYHRAIDKLDHCHTYYEFVRGDIPKYHQYGMTSAEKKQAYEYFLARECFKVGKYKGRKFVDIRNMDERYFWWADGAGLVPQQLEVVDDEEDLELGHERHQEVSSLQTI